MPELPIRLTLAVETKNSPTLSALRIDIQSERSRHEPSRRLIGGAGGS